MCVWGGGAFEISGRAGAPPSLRPAYNASVHDGSKDFQFYNFTTFTESRMLHCIGAKEEDQNRVQYPIERLAKELKPVE